MSAAKRLAVLAAVVAGTVCSVASAATVRWTDANPGGALTPTPNDDGTFTWPNPPWAHSGPATAGQTDDGDPMLTASIPNMTLAPGEMRAFQLDNSFNPKRFKRAWITFQYEGGFQSPRWEDPLMGVHPRHGNIVPVWSVAEYLDNGIFFSLTINIGPQPDWEVFRITNTGNAPLMMSNIEVGSACVPGPSSIALLALGAGVASLRRRGSVS
jgi:hypothetical protein